MDTLTVGNKLKVKGPDGHVFYHSKGHFTIHGESVKGDKLSMIAGGTGITPMFQLIKNILHNPEDKTEISLIFSNKTNKDILLRKELDEFAEKHKNFKVWYTVSQESPSKEWNFSVGRITESMFIEHLFPPNPNTIALGINFLNFN